MTPVTLSRLKSWFIDYAEGFESRDPHKDGAYRLKIDHTLRVCENIHQVGKSLSLADGEMNLAQAVGLFHDVGRFEQFARYRTFNDSKSINHARLSLQVLGWEAMWRALPLYERRLAAAAVAYHNAAALPDAEPRHLRFMRLIRDADKLDIWKVVIDYYHREDKTRNPTIELGLPDTPSCSEKVVKTLASGRFVRTRDLRTLNDFKLLQISWVYDLNYRESFQMTENRAIIDAIASVIPGQPEVDAAIAAAREHVYRMARRPLP
jgi:hypothetical protein